MAFIPGVHCAGEGWKGVRDLAGRDGPGHQGRRQDDGQGHRPRHRRSRLVTHGQVSSSAFFT